MQSGIGVEEELHSVGIESKVQLSGFGKNLQDHPASILQYELKAGNSNAAFEDCDENNGFYKNMILDWKSSQNGTGSDLQGLVGAFLKSNPSVINPDIEIQLETACLGPSDSGLRWKLGIQLLICLLAPTSSGTVQLFSKNPQEPPLIDMNILSTNQDVDRLADAFLLGRRIVKQRAFEPFIGKELLPGAEVESKEQIAKWLRNGAATMQHACGTCRMGSATDPHSVVDHQLRLLGMRSLRVVDASVFPRIPRGNTNAPTILLAERAATFILECDQN